MTDRRARRTVRAVTVALALGAVVATGCTDDDGGIGTGRTTVATTTTAPRGATTTTPQSATPDATAIWPAPGSGTRFEDPVAAARDFAGNFLRFRNPLVGAFRQGDSRSGEVEIRADEKGPATTVLVRQLSGSDAWSVLGAATANIDVTGPGSGDEISSPVAVVGRAVAFEGTVDVEVREDGVAGAIGKGFVTGGGDAMRPFEGSIAFETPSAPYGALVFFTTSAEDGRVWEAAAFRVRFASMEVKVYFDNDGDGGVALVPVYRVVPRTAAVLRASLDALVAGPTAAERAAGISSWFSPETAGMVRSVALREGHAVVDFDDLRTVISGASSSAGSARLLAELDATVFQFRAVESAEYRLLGDCEAFTEWLQAGGCEKRTRADVSAG